MGDFRRACVVINTNWEVNQRVLEKKISESNISNLLVHSDAAKALNYIDYSIDPNENLQKHIGFIESLCENIFLPYFNYDFPKSKFYDVRLSKSEVGIIPNAFSDQKDYLKSFDPMFSLIGNNMKNKFTDYIDIVESFKEDGIFSILNNKDSGILFYGAKFSSAVIIHYVESLMNIPYRYYKEIHGQTLYKEEKKSLIFRSHFRPLNSYFDYDWKRIEEDLLDNQILQYVSKYCLFVNASKLVNFWSEMIRIDQFYFLDLPSKEWVIPRIEKLGRPFNVEDFE